MGTPGGDSARPPREEAGAGGDLKPCVHWAGKGQDEAQGWAELCWAKGRGWARGQVPMPVAASGAGPHPGVGWFQSLAAPAWAFCGPRSSQRDPRTLPVRLTVRDTAPGLESVLCSAQTAQGRGAEQGPQDRTVSVRPLPLAFAEVTSRDSGPLSAAICIREEPGGAAPGGRDHLPVFQNLSSDKGIGPSVRLLCPSQAHGAQGRLDSSQVGWHPCSSCGPPSQLETLLDPPSSGSALPHPRADRATNPRATLAPLGGHPEHLGPSP